MAKRDPAKTARNKEAATLRQRMDELLPEVLDATGCSDLLSLNAKIGSKHEQLCNIRERCIRTGEEFLSLYLDSLMKRVLSLPPAVRPNSAFYCLGKWYQDSGAVREYMESFLLRSFLRHYDEYSRVKPVGDTCFWIGEMNADWGLLVVPRFRNGDWENDKSEIRKLKAGYFTIGHILESGLVVPGKNKKVVFKSATDYLDFFQNVLVRKAGSQHQDAVAERYCAFVDSSDEPERVPLLIPELRYRGRQKKHRHRLDFCVVDPYTLQRIGFELSPWSSHGRLSGTKDKNVSQVNAEAKANYEYDVRKCEAYFTDYGIHVTVFTDSDLADPDSVFGRIASYLAPEERPQQLFLCSRRRILEMDLDAEVEEG